LTIFSLQKLNNWAKKSNISLQNDSQGKIDSKRKKKNIQTK
jgi:hypothetical protein